eukprot:12057993-Alexandrium_andersonii.AAC.1
MDFICTQHFMSLGRLQETSAAAARAGARAPPFFSCREGCVRSVRGVWGWSANGLSRIEPV